MLSQELLCAMEMEQLNKFVLQKNFTKQVLSSVVRLRSCLTAVLSSTVIWQLNNSYFWRLCSWAIAVSNFCASAAIFVASLTVLAFLLSSTLICSAALFLAFICLFSSSAALLCLGSRLLCRQNLFQIGGWEKYKRSTVAGNGIAIHSMLNTIARKKCNCIEVRFFTWLRPPGRA